MEPTRILIADADRDNRAAMMWFLLSQGFWVEPVANGLDAATSLDGERPDLLITDLYLPVVNGRRVIERLRSMPGLARVPVLAIALDPPYAALPAGVEFLKKPCDPQLLLAAVERLLGDDARRIPATRAARPDPFAAESSSAVLSWPVPRRRAHG